MKQVVSGERDYSKLQTLTLARATCRRDYQHTPDPPGQQNLQKDALIQRQKGAVWVTALRPEGAAVEISRIRAPGAGVFGRG